MYNTKNPVEPNGSNDPRDLDDNARVLDLLINGDASEVISRLGKKLRSITELQNIITSLDLGAYIFTDTASGIAGTNSGQYFRVPQGSEDNGTFIYYKNDNGAAVQVAFTKEGWKEFLDKKIPFESYTLSDGDNPVTFTDADGNILFLIDAAGNYITSSTPKSFHLTDTSDNAFMMSDEEGNVLFLIDNQGNFVTKNGLDRKIPFTTYKMKDDPVNILSVTDEEGNTVLSIDSSGILHFSGTEQDTSSDIGAIAFLSAKGSAQASAGNLITLSNNQRPTKKLTIYIVTGQSYSIGADSEKIITTAAYDGNLMLGTKVYGDVGTGQAFVPTGNANFNPLAAVEKESPSIAFLNELKRLFNIKNNVESDPNHLFATIEPGIGARSINAMLTGDAWVRYDTALQKLADAAKNAGYEVSVGGLWYIQGEDDRNNTYDYYYSQLGVLIKQYTAQVVKYFPNNKPFDFYISQIGGNFASATQGVEKAQIDFCRDNAKAFFVGSYQNLPPNPTSKVHLIANSYRKFASMAAKTAFKAMCGNKNTIFRMVGAKHKRNVIYVGFAVPYPPLQFKNAYNSGGVVMWKGKGFSIVDDSGKIPGDNLTVEIVSSNVIKITCDRELSGSVTVRLGDNDFNNGRHNICDSDPSVSAYSWEPTIGSFDDIAELNNKPYELQNWAALDSITSEVF